MTTAGNISSLIASSGRCCGHERRAIPARRTTMAVMMLRAMQLVVQFCALGTVSLCLGVFLRAAKLEKPRRESFSVQERARARGC